LNNHRHVPDVKAVPNSRSQNYATF